MLQEPCLAKVIANFVKSLKATQLLFMKFKIIAAQGGREESSSNQPTLFHALFVLARI